MAYEWKFNKRPYTDEEAKELLDEGIAVAPLPFPVTPPGKAN